MAKEYLIAHISDLHLSPKYFPERTNIFRSLLLQCRQMNVDHIVITGDVTNQAKKEELEHFREVLNEFSLLDGKKVTAVIGNHDIFGGPYHAEDVLKFPSTCKTTDYDMRVEEFYKAAKETCEGAKFFSSKSVYPFLKILGDVAIVGVNSIARWNALKNPLGSNGKVDKEQQEALKTIFSSTLLKGKHVIVAIHHHFNKTAGKKVKSQFEKLWLACESATMKLYKKKRLLKLFRSGGVETILHGHLHEHNAYQRHGVRCFNAGASIIPDAEARRYFHLLAVHGTRVVSTTIPAENEVVYQKMIRIKQKKKSVVPSHIAA
jgi:Icc protein